MPTNLVVGHLKTHNKDARDQVLKQFDEIVKYSKANEPGVLKYAITIPRDESDQTSIYAIEEYADQAVSDAHTASPPVQDLIKMFSAPDTSPLSGPPKVYQLQFTKTYARPKSLKSIPDPYIVFATCDLDSSKSSGLIQVWTSVVQMAEKDEPKTYMYGLFKNKESTHQIGTVEVYEDEQAFEDHCKAEVVEELVEAAQKVEAKFGLAVLKMVTGFWGR